MEYQKAYYLLFNAITDALEALEQQNFGRAKQGLISAQQRAEELFLEDELEPGSVSGPPT